MQRQTNPSGLAARWAVKSLDIDPFHLPIRYSLPLSGVLGQYFYGRDDIILGRRSVYIRRMIMGQCVSSERHALSSFDGISISIEARKKDGCKESDSELLTSINLRHRDERLCLPLFMDYRFEDAGARWQALGRMLRLPLMTRAKDDRWVFPFQDLGLLGVYQPISRPAQIYLASRRPRILKFRSVGEAEALRVLQGQEIIARD